MKRLLGVFAIAACVSACGSSSSTTAPSPGSSTTTLQPPVISVPAGMIAETFLGAMSPGDARCTLNFGSSFTVDEGPCTKYTFTFSAVPGSISADVVSDKSLVFSQLYEVAANRVLTSADAKSFIPPQTHFDTTITRAGVYELRVDLGSASGLTHFAMVVVHSRLQ